MKKTPAKEAKIEKEMTPEEKAKLPPMIQKVIQEEEQEKMIKKKLEARRKVIGGFEESEEEEEAPSSAGSAKPEISHGAKIQIGKIEKQLRAEGLDLEKKVKIANLKAKFEEEKKALESLIELVQQIPDKDNENYKKMYKKWYNKQYDLSDKVAFQKYEGKIKSIEEIKQFYIKQLNQKEQNIESEIQKNNDIYDKKRKELVDKLEELKKGSK